MRITISAALRLGEWYPDTFARLEVSLGVSIGVLVEEIFYFKKQENNSCFFYCG